MHGVGANDPPVTGGAVFDTFEHDGGTHADLIRIAAERNGPMRVERFEQGSWQPYPETFPATCDGYDGALMFRRDVARLDGRNVRIVTRGAAVVPHEDEGGGP